MSISSGVSSMSSDPPGISPEQSCSSNPVKKCIQALEKAETDNEKFNILFVVPNLLKGSQLCTSTNHDLIQAIGFSYLARMLRSKDSPSGNVGRMYQSVALSVLSCFLQDKDIITNPAILFNLPELLDIISDADNSVFEDNLLLINDAYQCIKAILGTKKGRQCFINSRGVNYLCDIIVKDTFQCEESLKLLTEILLKEGKECWSYHSSYKDFGKLMMKFCQELSILEDEDQEQLCRVVKIMIETHPKLDDSKMEDEDVRLDVEVWDTLDDSLPPLYEETWLPLEEEEWFPHLTKGLQCIYMSPNNEKDEIMELLHLVGNISNFELSDLKVTRF